MCNSLTHTHIQTPKHSQTFSPFCECFMAENMDEIHCNYFHGGCVFSLVTHCLLIKTGNIYSPCSSEFKPQLMNVRNLQLDASPFDGRVTMLIMKGGVHSQCCVFVVQYGFQNHKPCTISLCVCTFWLMLGRHFRD